ncbi:lysosomal acid phosphatase-like isoform X1 [Homalodisca vitripennis]|uniref:lysosomal acid phosphatase-like isoform X1 n=1 Tax=Homalodisca vitripennis TaxID=197043 RepID=UPI001EEB3BC5|nr:lysosomal acid phosphatase-like isoform X1 [Homalodisca vitripennis]
MTGLTDKMPAYLLWLSTIVAVVLASLDSSANPEEYVAPRSASTGTRSVPTLQFVAVVTRHGSIAPFNTFSSSLYQSNDTSVWPFGEGELTQIGRVQMYKLGQIIRSLYDGFLDQAYQPDEFKASSSFVGRALQSAELFLAGLFPPAGYQVWNEHLLWQPIPVFPSLFDHHEMVLIDGNNLCPKFKEAQKLSLMKVNQVYSSILTTFLDYVLPHTGIDERLLVKNVGSAYRIQTVFLVWESLEHASNNGLPLPDWANKIYPEPISSLWFEIAKALFTDSLDQIKYMEGELFQELVGLMQSKANNTLSPDTRMYYYSGHDYTLLALLAMLGQRSLEEIGFVSTGSALIYELHRDPDTNQFYIEVMFVDGAAPEWGPMDVDIQGCDPPCDLYQLLNITEKYYKITNWKEECNFISKTA